MAGPVGALDGVLQWFYAVYQFSAEPDCMLRAARTVSPRDAVLSDGAIVERGAPILQLHLWNENLPRIPRGGLSVDWAMLLHRRLERSLCLLACHVAHDAPTVTAVTARCAFVVRADRAQLARLAASLGFDLLDDVPPPGWLGQIHDFLENIYVIGLIIAFNPKAKRRGVLRRERFQVWMSRERLLTRYGQQDHPAQSAPRWR